MRTTINKYWREAVQVVIALVISIIIVGTYAVFGMRAWSQELIKIEESGVDIPVDMPTIIIPTVLIPVVAIPEVIIPQVNLVTTITSAEFAMLVDSPSILLNKILIPSADIPVVENASKGVVENIAKVNNGIANEMVFQKTDHPKNFITDKRTVRYLKDGGSGNLIWKAWKEVYAKDYPPMEYVRVPDVTQIKMICEMKATQTQAERDNLIKELTYFKSFPVVIDGRTVYQSYNTVLAVWEGEPPATLLEQIALVKGMGYKVFFTYGTRERLDDKIFIDPEKYRYGLTLLASSCDGYLVGWRRTSLHLFRPDENMSMADFQKFANYSIQCIRSSNSTIPVFGEIYRGYAGNNNKDGSDNKNEFLVNIPANASGAFVVNFGFAGVRPDGVLKLIRASTDVPLIALIVGERPYYMTRNDNKKSKAENRTIIDSIEKRFKKYDFGTATLTGDGSNEVYEKNVSDDISEMNWSN
jgi:hypothetical protein